MKYRVTTQIELILDACDVNHAYKIASKHLEEAVENMKWDHVKSANLTQPKIERI